MWMVLVLAIAACSGNDAATTAAAATAADGAAGDGAAGDGAAGDAATTDGGSSATPPCLPENLDPKPTSNTGIPGAPLESPWGPPDCDPVHPVHCAYPWPSMWHLKPDPKTKTGYRLRFGKNVLPVDSNGKSWDSVPYRRLDGYSTGTSLLMLWPHLDDASLAHENAIELSVAPTALVQWLELDADGKVKRRIPYFVELDAQEPDSAKRTLFVRPGVILEPGTRYVVGVRQLQDQAGKPYARSPAFEALVKDDPKLNMTVLMPHKQRYGQIFAALDSQGVKKEELLLAWDFVTKSDDNDHGAVLTMRDAALAATGPDGPKLTQVSVKEFAPAENADIALEVSGTMHVPVFLDAVPVDGHNVTVLHRCEGGLPVITHWEDREWLLRVPRSAIKGPPHPLVQYGHGLNGTLGEVRSGYLGQIANQEQVMFYAAHMRGMSTYEVPTIITAVTNLSAFPAVTETLHQGMIEWLLLQRAMKQRLGDLPFAKKYGVQPDGGRMWYFGNSQGGIFGGTAVALSQDVTRGDLGVCGSNYSLLLQRSTDFDSFFEIIRIYLPGTHDQAVALLAIQLLWDAVDPVTHYRHLAQAPYPNTPAHAVLMDPAKGDWQVANVTNEILARSKVGVALMAGYGKPVALVEPQAYPYTGSGIVMWDYGNSWPSLGNKPPAKDVVGPCGPNDSCGKDQVCAKVDGNKQCVLEDPHESPRRSPEHTQQMLHFFRTGEIIDVCGGDGCHPN
jgi:hypothetical protein